MSGGNGGASAIAALALAIRHAPARHSELLRGNAPLPPGVGILLRLAGGTSLQELDPALASLGPENELRKAALFFIEEVMFRRDADHYRLLGLPPEATPEQIKEHHRLLMRMFHPDRDSHLDERREQFATRANLAYNTLRDAGARADYDASLKPQTTRPVQAPRRAPMPARRRMAQPESFWSVRVHPLLMRYLPQWVLAGTALVSLAIVGAVYLSNPPIELPRSAAAMADSTQAGAKPLPAEAPGQDAGVEIVTGDATGLNEVVSQFEHRIAAAKASMTETAAAQDMEAAVPAARARLQPAPAVPVTAAREKPAVSEPVQTTRTRTRAPAEAATPAPAAAPPAAQKAVPAESRVSAQVAAAPQNIAQPAPEPAPRLAAVAPPAPAPVEAPPPRAPLPDPNTLLERFLQAYERGDMQSCLALLDEGVRVNAGSKSELRQEYDALFRSTDLRHVKILSMSWSRDGEFIRGEGRYRATFMRKGETVLRTQDGQVRVELVRRGGTALINELYYLASGRS